MQIVLSNIIERESLTLSGDLTERVHLTNIIQATILLHPINTKKQWLLKTGFWDDGGIWDDSQEWID